MANIEERLQDVENRLRRSKICQLGVTDLENREGQYSMRLWLTSSQKGKKTLLLKFGKYK